MTLILIPPSEGKVVGGRGAPLKVLSPQVQAMYDRLVQFKGDVNDLYGVKGKALDKATAANRDVIKAPTLPAIERYSGVVYDGIDYSSLSKASKVFLNAHVRIVSALFGLLNPQDVIPDYKLKIEKLDSAKYWKPIITQELKGCFVIDLLPQAHQKAVHYEKGIKIDFIFYKNGKLMPAGHQGKLIKGKFIRWLCVNQITNPDDFTNFIEDGFKFDGTNFIKRY